jgi:hypothetical protein
MSALDNGEIQAFLSAVRRSPELWRSVDLRSLAVRLQDGWHNLLTRVYLDPRQPESIESQQDLPVTEHLGCFQSITQPEDIERILIEVAQGRLTVRNQLVAFRAIKAAPGSDRYSFNRYRRLELFDRGRASYRPWSAYSLSAGGNTAWDVLNEISGGRYALDNELRTHPAPFDGIDSAVQFVLEAPDPQRDDQMCFFEAFAPLQGSLVSNQCTISGGELRYEVRAGSEAASERLNLGFLCIRPNAPPKRGSLSLAEAQWECRQGEWYCRGSVAVSDATRVTLILRLAGAAIDRTTVIGGSPGNRAIAVNAYGIIDPGLSHLQSLLRRTTKDGRAFERGVARLLGLAGLQVDLLGSDKELSDAIDILAFDPFSMTCLAVECTTLSVNSGKLGKLVGRAGQIRLAVPNTEIVGVIVSALPSSALSKGELEDAAKDGVAVLASEDLEELLLMASRGAPSSEVCALVRGRIGRDEQRYQVRPV